MFLLICKSNIKVKTMAVQTQDSRLSSILLNLNLSTSSSAIANEYTTSTSKINESAKGDKIKSYKSLRQTMQECYLTGSLKYGNNFIM